MTGSILQTLLTGFSLVWTGDGSGFVEIPGDVWLDPGSITAVVSGDTVTCTPWARGERPGLLLDPVPEPGDTVLITADTLAISVPSTVKLELQPVHSGGAYEIPWSTAGSDPIPEGLYISGSKQLGVSVGSGGGISQGTELSIQGMLSSGITVDGRITDRNLPLGAGASEALSELDRVYVGLDGGSWNAEMGDLEWESSGPVQWNADPSGFHGGVTPWEPLTLSAGYGTTGSERHSGSFLTEEGLQGPYRFAPEGGVTPGSEKVFLDGELMERGPGADYTVEYAAGELTFNTGRLIRRDQRLEVSWYREGDGFRKNLYTGVASARVLEGLTVGFSTFSRKDDTGVPLGFVMSDEVEEALAAAGDDPAAAWIEGGTQVGEGNGSYTRDSLQIYHWAGPGGGDWSVEFQKPPQGPGDYTYDSSIGGYVWTGDSLGTHYPRRYLSIPTSNEIAGVEISGAAGAVESFTVHSTFSQRSGNLFSDMNTTRQGTLSGGGVSVRPWEEGPLFSLQGRYISQGFEPPDELDLDRDLQRWGLPVGWKGRDDFILGSVSGGTLTLSGGDRRLEDGGSSRIAETFFGATAGMLNLSLSADGLFRNGSPLLTDGRRGIFTADLTLDAGNFEPFLVPSYTAESWPDSTSGKIIAAETGIRHSGEVWSSEFTAGGELDRRWGITGPDRTLSLGLSGNGNGQSWNASGSAAHSTGWFEGGGSTSSDAVKLSWSRRFGGAWVHSRYTAGGYISREMDIVYTWVGEGNGDYSYDPDTGEYYPDPMGDYVVNWVPGQGETRVLEAKLTGGVSWSDSSGSAGMDGSFTLEASDPDDRLSTYSTAGAFDTSTPGLWKVSVTPWMSWEESLLSRLTLRANGYDSVEDFSGSGRTREIRRSLEVVPLLVPEEWLEIEITGRTASRIQSIYGERETEENSITVDPVYLARGFDIGIALSLESRYERNDDLNASGWSLEPHSTLNASGWSARMRFTATRVGADQEVPSWLFDGMTRGWTLEPSVSVGRNLNRWFRLSLFYWGRKRPDAEWEQRGGVEGMVNF